MIMVSRTASIILTCVAFLIALAHIWAALSVLSTPEPIWLLLALAGSMSALAACYFLWHESWMYGLVLITATLALGDWLAMYAGL
jgi:hypothetical protein